MTFASLACNLNSTASCVQLHETQIIEVCETLNVCNKSDFLVRITTAATLALAGLLFVYVLASWKVKPPRVEFLNSLEEDGSKIENHTCIIAFQILLLVGTLSILSATVFSSQYPQWLFTSFTNNIEFCQKKFLEGYL